VSAISSDSTGTPIPNPILKMTPGRTRGTILCETDLERASDYKAMVRHGVLQDFFAPFNEVWREAHFSGDPLPAQDPAPLPIQFNTPVVKPMNTALSNFSLKPPCDNSSTHSKRTRHSYDSRSRKSKKKSRQPRRDAELYHQRDDRTRNSSSHVSPVSSGMSLSSNTSNESERRTNQESLSRINYGNFSDNFVPPGDDHNRSDSGTTEKRKTRWGPPISGLPPSMENPTQVLNSAHFTRRNKEVTTKKGKQSVTQNTGKLQTSSWREN